MPEEGELRFAPDTLLTAQGRLVEGPEGPALDQASALEGMITIGPFGEFDAAPAAVGRLQTFAGAARTDLGTVQQEVGSLAQASGAAADEATGWRDESTRIASSVGPVVVPPEVDGGN